MTTTDQQPNVTRAQQQALNNACAKHGIPRHKLREYLTGSRTPAPWLARQLAAAIGQHPHQLFPGHDTTMDQQIGAETRGGGSYVEHDRLRRPPSHISPPDEKAGGMGSHPGRPEGL